MFVFNIKLNKKAIFKTSLAIMIIICVGIGVAAVYNVISSINLENNLIDDSIPYNEIAEIKPENYTNILKSVHENLDTYIGQKIRFSGYVYRLNGFSENQFVLARDMDIGNKQTLIVGFLCSYENIKDFPIYTWVTITGEITKGNYNNSEIPILKITAIEESTKPENATVALPDDTYVPTAVIY